jgi:hypothetical protein
LGEESGEIQECLRSSAFFLNSPGTVIPESPLSGATKKINCNLSRAKKDFHLTQTFRARTKKEPCAAVLEHAAARRGVSSKAVMREV